MKSDTDATPTEGLRGGAPKGASEALVIDPHTMVFHDAERPFIRIFAWERDGAFYNALPADGADIPYDAAEMFFKAYDFPNGSVRVVKFSRGVRTHDHENMTDTLTYTLTGRRVQFVNDRALETRPGEPAFHPRGVFHHSETLEAGLSMEFAFHKAQPGAAAHAIWNQASDAPLVAEGEYKVRTYSYPGYALREIHLSAGDEVASVIAEGDGLMFVVSGAVEVTSGGQAFTAEIHDAVRVVSGLPLALRSTQASVLLQAFKTE